MNSSACRQSRTPEPQVGVCVWSVSRWNDLMFCPHCRIVQPWYTPVFWSLKSVVVTCQAILNSSVDDPECTSARNIVGHNFGTDWAPVMLNFSYVENILGLEFQSYTWGFCWVRAGTPITPGQGQCGGLPSYCEGRAGPATEEGRTLPDHCISFIFHIYLKCWKFFYLYKHVFFMKVILKPDSLKCLLLRKLV